MQAFFRAASPLLTISVIVLASQVLTATPAYAARAELGEAIASSTRQAYGAAGAVDRDKKTRWEADKNGASLTVMLAECYKVDDIVIDWHGRGEFGYTVYVSRDAGKTWKRGGRRQVGEGSHDHSELRNQPANAIKIQANDDTRPRIDEVTVDVQRKASSCTDEYTTAQEPLKNQPPATTPRTSSVAPVPGSTSISSPSASITTKPGLSTITASGNPAPAAAPAPAANPAPATASFTGGSGGSLSDRTFLSFSNGKYTSKYHIFAAGLDWSKPVGMMVYCDGSGEYGLNNPGSTYLLAGSDGMIAVAKRHNMILLTPFSPNTRCTDKDGGACWYMGDAPGYAKWSADLIKDIQRRYNIDKNRLALGGYSSGAEWITMFFTPGGHAAEIMTGGVAVAISYGSAPESPARGLTAAFKANVHFNWNTGDKDEAYTRPDGVRDGYNWYTSNGFKTSLNLIKGLGHERDDFGKVMDAQIQKHLPK